MNSRWALSHYLGVSSLNTACLARRSLTEHAIDGNFSACEVNAARRNRNQECRSATQQGRPCGLVMLAANNIREFVGSAAEPAYGLPQAFTQLAGGAASVPDGV
jgi:hypothetical protein